MSVNACLSNDTLHTTPLINMSVNACLSNDTLHTKPLINKAKSQNWRIFVPRDLKIWWMTWKNNRAPLLYYIKLCAAFQNHWYIQTGVTVWKHSICVKIGDFLSCVTLKIDGWPCKTIGHLSYADSNFVLHFIAIGEFNLELQSGNAQYG